MNLKNINYFHIKSRLSRSFRISRIYWDYWTRHGISYYPGNILFNLTFRCNLRCRMCGQWGDSGFLKTRSKEQNDKMLAITDLKKIIDDVSFFKPAIYLWGGEPFLYPNLIELMNYIIDEKGLECSINTNGTYLKEFAPALVKLNNPFTLVVSLDGPAEIHDYIRGKKGSFNEITEGIKIIQNLKKIKSQKHPGIFIVTVITKDSFKLGSLKDILDIAVSLEAECLILGLSWFTTNEKGMEYNQLMKKLFDCQADSWKGFLIDIDGIDIASIKHTITELRNNKNKLKIKLIPNLKLKQIARYYSDINFTIGRKRCVLPWYSANIMPNGDVTLCSDYPDYILGNIKEESFLNIWDNEKAVRFRQKLKKHKIFPICNRCCGLYLP